MQLGTSWNIHLSILKLTGKSEYAKHVVRNITSSKAAREDNKITGRTTSAQVLFYFNVHIFCYDSEHTRDLGSRGVYIPPPPPTNIST